MLFFTTIIAVLIAAAVYVSTKKKKTPSSYAVESTVSIHEEIAKTVEEAKTQAPIVDEISKPKAVKKAAPKAKKTEAPTMAAKKPTTKKTKTTVNA